MYFRNFDSIIKKKRKPREGMKRFVQQIKFKEKKWLLKLTMLKNSISIITKN